MDNTAESLPHTAMKKCAKPWCKNMLDIDDKKKSCAKCREADAKNQRAKKARDALPPATPATTESRKRRPSSTSTDDRPTTRPRVDDDQQSGSDDEMRDFERENNKAAETFSDAESFFDSLRADFKAGQSVDFHGTYKVAADPLVTPKQRVQMVAAEIWKATGYRFTVKDHRKLKSGHRTRLWCSQDEARKEKSKASQNPDIRNRDNVGMKRYPSKSKLAISCQTSREDDDELDGALDMILEDVEWLIPVAMVSKVQAAFPTVTAAQIHRAWMEMSEIYWRRDDLQLPSAAKLLEEHGEDVDIFKPENVPEGVEMLCWGMKKIAGPLKGKIVEIGVDATYNTNSKHLELYSIMGEYDNAGFPLSYLLLSTASSIDQGKRRAALTAWAKCLRNAYGVTVRFTHVDKDMAEIGMLKDVWNAKISLCWWHLRRAVRTRLASSKLATTPYDAARAKAEFAFIDVRFVPLGQADGAEYEGGVPDSISPVVPASQQPQTLEMANGLRITIPARQPLPSAAQNGVALPVSGSRTARDPGASSAVDDGVASAATTTVGGVQTRTGRVTKPPARNADAADPTSLARAINARATGTAAPKATKGRKAAVKTDDAAASSSEDEAAASSGEDEEGKEETKTRRTFCPASYRESIINMMERHYCAHPLLPGSAHPSPEGIKRWAVTQMYKFCVEHGLREVWAYLWENWYRKSRWELWARSVHPEIPVLKTTMILESHWRRIKHDFLHHFHMPRCDLLAWILIVKLAPNYYRKLDRLLTDTGRYRELPSWRKNFKKVWRKLEKTPITLPVNPAYKTDAKKMGVEPVPPVFFLEVKRQRTAPFWVHPSLRPLSNDSGAAAEPSNEEEERHESPSNAAIDSGDDSDSDSDDLVDTQIGGNQVTFLEAMDENIDLITDFLNGLKYQRQFRDQRMLQTLEREGASFFRLAKACLRKEKRLTSTRGEAPSTWDRSASSAMFYRARPGRSDENT
ncbi:SWIM-type domain-containing protein [Mycena venus]|uniref:SWIM-type domain-containing protein n=1 Tax=Mycena venus TaxID=2733690 RepID=A0A8H6Y741_9AGAR|nr:SWIM-type domain-containing protein [Mycena venus]